jgi:transcriptional regulator with XRE-family HTH domain
LTQAEVADGIRIATEVYGRMERGRMLPSVPTLLRMCITLRCRPDELMGFSPEPSPQAGPYRAGKLPEGLEDSPDVRRLLRHLKRLDPRKLKLLTEVTAAVL